MDMTYHDEPLTQIMMSLYGARITAVVSWAAIQGVPDKIAAGAKDVPSLAHELQYAEWEIEPFLDALAAVGVLQRSGDALTLTPMGELLRSDHPRSQRAAAVLQGRPEIWHTWRELANGARVPAFEQAVGVSFWDHTRADPDFGLCFDRAMTALNAVTLEAVIAAYPWKNGGCYVDLGGGRGQLLAGLLAALPQARGVLVDLPSVLERVGEFPVPLRGRIALRPADLFDRHTLPRDGNIFLLQRVVHDWGDEDAIRMLANIRDAMPRDARLLMLEFTRNPGGPQGWMAAHLHLTMHAFFRGGCERTMTQLQSLLERAQLRPGGTYACAGTPLRIIEAYK